MITTVPYLFRCTAIRQVKTLHRIIGNPIMRHCLLPLLLLARTSPHIPILVLFSDFQSNAAHVFDSLFAVDSTRYALICVSLAPDKPLNYSISSVLPAREDPSMLAAVVAAQGKAYTGNGLSAFSSGLRIGQTGINVGANSTATTYVRIRAGNWGNRIRIYGTGRFRCAAV